MTITIVNAATEENLAEYSEMSRLAAPGQAGRASA